MCHHLHLPISTFTGCLYLPGSGQMLGTQREIRCELSAVTGALVNDGLQCSIKADGYLGYLENGLPLPQTQGQKWLPEESWSRISLAHQWQVSLLCWQSPQLFSGFIGPHVTLGNSNLPKPIMVVSLTNLSDRFTDGHGNQFRSERRCGGRVTGTGMGNRKTSAGGS